MKEKTLEKKINSLIAKDVINILKTKQYVSSNDIVVDISSLLDYTVKNTVVYEENLPNNECAKELIPKLEITNETTTQAAVRLLGENKDNIVILNFASACCPGGGFVAGAVAQEEDLCRHSGLYFCLKSKPQFYNKNILFDNSLYTDSIIYSPLVPFIRGENNLLLDEPYLLSVISAPAPNVSESSVFMDDLDSIIRNRIHKIIQIAKLNGHKNIVLGAWGCGAFCNDPYMVAEAFRDILKRNMVFEHICFAIYDNRPNTPILNSFKEIFDENIYY